jgi:ArsR family transcriptional regulator
MAGQPASDAHATESGEPGPLLPEHSVLSLDEYLAMQRAIGNEIRFRLLRTLKARGDMSAKELETTLDIEGNKLHYHLDKLVDVGLVENRKRKEPNSSGLYSYYRASALGEGILEHGVEELIRDEWRSLERYSK